MNTLNLIKSDGRQLTLYSRRPLSGISAAPSPFAEPLNANPQLRWHPLRGEWVAYAAFRQNRTFAPPPEYNPLAATTESGHPTELPAGDYDIAVFDNRFPSLVADAHDVEGALPLPVDTMPASGHCEVIVFSQDPDAALATLDLSHIELLFDVWADRTLRAAQRANLHYVLIFENRGAEVGVTLHHPHGQLYGYPIVPPVPQRMLAQEAAYFMRHQRALLCQMAADEMKDGNRVLYCGDHAIAFVPPCARYPYEVWVMPIAQTENFSALTEVQRRDLARALKTVLLKYEGLWQRPFPYLMSWFQAPLDGKAHPETQLHAQFYPPYRSRDRLKYLAGTELAAGLFVMDTLPETTAHELQQVVIEMGNE